MKKLWIAALLSIFCAPAIALAQTEQEAKERSASEAAAGDSEKPQGPGSEHHPESEEGDPTRHFNFIGGPFDHLGKDEYGGKFGDGEMKLPSGETVHEEEPMSPAFIWMLVNFAILLLILLKWFRPMARRVAKERHDLIQTALDDATALRTQAAQKLAEYEARIKNVDDEVKKIVDGIRADAHADKQRILAAAQEQAAQLKRDAEQRIAAEIETARAQLTREVTLAASNVAEKILRDKVTPDDQRKQVTTFISSIGAG